jgi:hypothetical protein
MIGIWGKLIHDAEIGQDRQPPATTTPVWFPVFTRLTEWMTIFIHDNALVPSDRRLRSRHVLPFVQIQPATLCGGRFLLQGFGLR